MLQHSFIEDSHNLTGLFNGVRKMSQLMRNIERQSEINIQRYPSNEYKGDAFEFFVELFLSLFSVSGDVFVYDYVPIPKHKDRGADGYGVNMKGDKCLVQIKYRSRNTPNKTLLNNNDDKIGNMFIVGNYSEHRVFVDDENKFNYRFFVFTTADDLHFYTDDEMYRGEVKCFNYESFKKIVDNNDRFWNKCRELVMELDPRLQQVV